jgi:ABC-type lipoprotein export system ATPase subunit
MKKRYPGPLPFSYDDKDVFFGRKDEMEYLATLTLNSRTTVIHGKSGFGKTSLINAGLIPELLRRSNCEIIRIRFYNYSRENPRNLKEIFLNTIQLFHESKISLPET